MKTFLKGVLESPVQSGVKHAPYIVRGLVSRWIPSHQEWMHWFQSSWFASVWSFLSLSQEASRTDRDYFWLRPILSSSLPFSIHSLAVLGQPLKPPAQWAAILGCLYLTFTVASWLIHSPIEPPLCWARVAQQPVLMPPNQRATSWNLAVSHADWTGKQLWAAKFNHSHFRNEELGDFEIGNWGCSLFFFLFYFSSDVWMNWLS